MPLCTRRLCVVGVDVDSVTEIRRFYALDDCGTRINPMIIEGQVHGGLTEALAIAMGQEMAFDEAGDLTNASLLDFFLPTAVETPSWEIAGRASSAQSCSPVQLALETAMRLHPGASTRSRL